MFEKAAEVAHRCNTCMQILSSNLTSHNCHSVECRVSTLVYCGYVLCGMTVVSCDDSLSFFVLWCYSVMFDYIIQLK